MAAEWIYPRSRLHSSPMQTLIHPKTFYLYICFSMHEKRSQMELSGFLFLMLAQFKVAATLSVFCSLHSWLSIVKQPLSHYLPLWTQKNMKSILHASQAGKFCY